MRRTELPNDEAAIMGRLIIPGEPRLSSVTARAILSLGFDSADKDRMHELAAKARAGTLTPREQAEVDAYSRVGSLLGILHSKARRAIKGRREANGKANTH